MRFDEDLFMNLDNALVAATNGMWPLWKTAGQGGCMPRRLEHDFQWHCLEDGARIDMYRGGIEHDRGNKEWRFRWYRQLPRFRGMIRQNPDSDVGCGNAVEMAAIETEINAA